MPETWGQEMHMTGYCAFCSGWTMEGTAAEVAQASREHRAQVHPDLPPPTRRRRPNLAAWRTHLNKQETVEIAVERGRRMRLLGIDDETEAAP